MDVIEVPVEAGPSLLVETESEDLIVAAGRVRDIAEAGIASFESAMESVQHAAEVAVARMTAMSRPPRQVSVEFAIQLAAEAGVVIAKTTGTANMNVVLTWDNTG